MRQHIVSVRTNVTIFLILQLLLVATVALAYVPLGKMHLTTSLTIAVAKAVLIVLYFMHIRWSRKLNWVFASASLVWFALLLALTMSDYLTRDWLPIPGK
ncbi:MAG: cytochrome C oxidase subunit IV family protein [Isosphaeraceae bacterium]